MKALLFLFAIASLSADVIAGREHVVGLWNDGLVGENTGIYFAADGVGESISLAVETISWTFDDASNVVTVSFRGGCIWRMTFDEKSERLISEQKRTENQDWIFHRLDDAAVQRWLKIRKENGA